MDFGFSAEATSFADMVSQMLSSPTFQSFWPLIVLLQLVAVFWLFVLVVRRPKPKVPPQSEWVPKVVLDGSNILYWRDQQPDFKPVREVVKAVVEQGYQPLVWFDANVGYVVHGRYYGPRDLANWIDLHHTFIFVSPKGTPADPLIIEMATNYQARVITNDRYRDWRDQYPILEDRSCLVRGHWLNGQVYLNDLMDLREVAAA